MEIKYGNGSTKYGPGVQIELTGDEVAIAIITYLVAHNVHVVGPRTVYVNNALCKSGGVYVDPCGYAISGGGKMSGRGEPTVQADTANGWRCKECNQLNFYINDKCMWCKAVRLN